MINIVFAKKWPSWIVLLLLTLAVIFEPYWDPEQEWTRYLYIVLLVLFALGVLILGIPYYKLLYTKLAMLK